MNNDIKMYDIVEADLGTNIGVEQSGRRPVVIIQNNFGNFFSKSTIVIPITSRQPMNLKQPTHALLKSSNNNGLHKDSLYAFIEDYMEDGLMTDEQKQELLHFYMDNEASRLKRLCHAILTQYKGIPQCDYDDYISIASNVLMNNVNTYNDDDVLHCKFHTFLYGNVQKRFITHFRDMNRKRRIPRNITCSLDAPIQDENGRDISETIASRDTVESKYEEEHENPYSDKMKEYLTRLSTLEKRVLQLIADGYIATEVMKILHITSGQYKSCTDTIRAYRNVSILF